MDVQNIDELTRIFQASISPVALISGVGLLILSQTNRLGRVMDRLRDVVEQRRAGGSVDPNLSRQVEVLYRRARILRASVTAAVLCALLAAVLVLLLFSSAVFGMRLDLPALAMFTGSLLSLIMSLAL